MFSGLLKFMLNIDHYLNSCIAYSHKAQNNYSMTHMSLGHEVFRNTVHTVVLLTFQDVRWLLADCVDIKCVALHIRISSVCSLTEVISDITSDLKQPTLNFIQQDFWLFLLQLSLAKSCPLRKRQSDHHIKWTKHVFFWIRNTAKIFPDISF